MAEGTPDGSAFGFYERYSEGGEPTEEQADVFGEQPPETPAVTDSSEPAEPEEPELGEEAGEPEGVPPADAEEPSGSEPEAGEEQPEGSPEEPQVYADAFKSVEALEAGYREAVAWNTRQAQEISALRQGLEDQQRMVAQLIMDQNQMRAANDPEFAEQWQVAQATQQAVEAQVAPLRQQFEQQQRQNELLTVISGFRQAHPDVIPNSPADQEVANVVRALDLDIGDPNALELAYEAYKDPFLRTVLVANPNWVETEAGLARAQEEAAKLAGSHSPTTGKQPRSKSPAHVETGSSGAPSAGAPGRVPDEWDQVMELNGKEKKSIFQT